MIRVSPVGLAAAPVANQLTVHLAVREKLCKSFCIDSSVQPLATIQYTTGTPVLNGTAVFIPVTARVTVVTGSGCCSRTELFTEQFYLAFAGQTAVPTSVTVTSLGSIQGGSCVKCGHAHSYSVNDVVTVAITPPAAAPA